MSRFIQGIETSKKHLPLYGKKLYQVMLTAHKDKQRKALQSGVFFDYLTKPLDKNELQETLMLFYSFYEELNKTRDKLYRAEVRAVEAEKKLAMLNWDTSNYKDGNYTTLKGTSMAMDQIRMFIDIYGKMNTPVLLLGETGTGKDVIAQEIHNHGRRGKPYFTVNCAALPENLLESTLFGYVKNAFTGARDKGKKGYFKLAEDGTLFLDEFGDLSSSAQNKILRVIENGDFIPVGSEKILKIKNVRIICATSRELLNEDENNSFRKDLIFRLSGFFPEIPPLRERKEDIKPILLYYRQKESLDGITPEIVEFLSTCDHNWPGNIRELLNFTRQSIALMVNQKLDIEKLSALLEIWKERQPKPSNKIGQVFKQVNHQGSQGDVEIPKEYEITNLKELLYKFLTTYQQLEKEKNRKKKPTIQEIELILKPENKNGWLSQYFATEEAKSEYIRFIIEEEAPDLNRLRNIPPIRKFFSK